MYLMLGITRHTIINISVMPPQKLVMEAQLIDACSNELLFDAKPGEQLLISPSEHVHMGESLKVLIGPLSEYTTAAVYTVELQDVPAACPFRKYPPTRFAPGTCQGVLQCVQIHVTP